MRVAVYTDYTYHCVDGEIYADRAFALFLTRLSAQLEAMTIAGRLDPTQGKARYRLGDHVDFAPLSVLPKPESPAVGRDRRGGFSLGRFWKLLATVDRVWLLGPHPLAFAFALMAFAPAGERSSYQIAETCVEDHAATTPEQPPACRARRRDGERLSRPRKAL